MRELTTRHRGNRLRCPGDCLWCVGDANGVLTIAYGVLGIAYGNLLFGSVKWTADDFLSILQRIPARQPVLVRGHPPQRLRDPAGPEPRQPRVERGHEPLGGHPGSVACAEELLLEQVEEPLGAGVVAAHALPRHAADEAGALAYGDPARPAVVPAAVGVDDRPLARGEPGAGALERLVRQRGVRGRAAGPPRRPPVVAVDHCVQVGPPRRPEGGTR